MKGGDIAYCRDPNFKLSRFNPNVKTPALQGVRAAKEIHYWGHYPVADLEFETDAPVSVGLRAWSPFIPGDTAASNIPASVFEVHLRNTSEAAQKGTIAFNFPGPDTQEALSSEFTRQEINEDFRGVFVASQGGVNYLLGVMGAENLRLGSGLNGNATAWSKDCDGTAAAQPAGVGRRARLHGLEQLGGGRFLARSRAEQGGPISAGVVRARCGRELTSPQWKPGR